MGSLAFRVGDPARSYDVIVGSRRRFSWIKGPHDLQLAELAGWSQLPREESGEFMAIDIPTATRAASNVLAGMSAWPAEKDELLAHMIGYLERVHTQFGAADVGVSLDSIGVTREDRTFFILPPHDLQADGRGVAAWRDGLLTDLHSVLISDPSGEEMVARFDAATRFLVHPGGGTV
jgi:hypothetical protein